MAQRLEVHACISFASRRLWVRSPSSPSTQVVPNTKFNAPVPSGRSGLTQPARLYRVSGQSRRSRDQPSSESPQRPDAHVTEGDGAVVALEQQRAFRVLRLSPDVPRRAGDFQVLLHDL